MRRSSFLVLAAAWSVMAYWMRRVLPLGNLTCHEAWRTLPSGKASMTRPPLRLPRTAASPTGAPLSPERPLGTSTATTGSRDTDRAATMRAAAPASGRSKPAPKSASTTSSALSSGASASGCTAPSHKAAWTAAKISWDAPRPFLEPRDGVFTLPDAALSAWGVSGAVQARTVREDQPDGRQLQSLVLSTADGRSTRVKMTTYGPHEGAMSWLHLRRATVIPEAGLLFGFLENACCGADLMALEPFVVKLDTVAAALQQP